MALPVLMGHHYVQAVRQRDDDDPVVNTFCIRDEVSGRNGVLDAEALEQVRDFFDMFYGDRSHTANDAGGVLNGRHHDLRYIVYPLREANLPAQEIASATFPTTPGSPTGSDMPPDVALVVTWRTEMRGKSYRGRTYLGPLRNINANGRPTQAALDQVSAGAGRLFPGGAQAPRNFRLAVMSRTLNIATPVISADVDNEFDTQRRRGFRSRQRTLIPGT